MKVILVSVSEELGNAMGVLVGKLSRAFHQRRRPTMVADYVEHETAGDRLIAQGHRLNLLGAMLTAADESGMPVRGNHITQDVSERLKGETMRRLRVAYRARQKNGDVQDSELNANLVEARTNMGKLHSRSLPVADRAR